jgi:hypothetical protein
MATPADTVAALRGSSVHLAVQGAYLFDRVWHVPVVCEDVVWFKGQRSGTFALTEMMGQDRKGTPASRLRAKGLLSVLPDPYWPDIEVLREAGVRISANRRRLTTSRYDIVDLGSREAWEIKPNNPKAIEDGRRQLAERLEMFKAATKSTKELDERTGAVRRDEYGWKARPLRAGVSWAPPTDDIYVGLRTYVRIKRLTDDPDHKDAGLIVYDVYRDGKRERDAQKWDDTLEALKEEIYVQIANRNLMIDIAQPVSAVMAILALAWVARSALTGRALAAAKTQTQVATLPARIEAISGAVETGSKAEAIKNLSVAAMMVGAGAANAASPSDVAATNESVWEQVQAVKGFLWDMFTTDKDTTEWWDTYRGTPFQLAAANPLVPRDAAQRPLEPAAPGTAKPATPAALPEWARVKEDDDIQDLAARLARRLQYGAPENSPTFRMQVQVVKAWLDGLARRLGGLRQALNALGVPDKLDPRDEGQRETIAAMVFGGSPDAIVTVNRHTAIWDWYLWEDPDVLRMMIYEPEALDPAGDQLGDGREYQDWREIVQ